MLKTKQNENRNSNTLSLYDEDLTYAQRMVLSNELQKRILQECQWTPENVENESLNEKPFTLTDNGSKHWKFCKSCKTKVPPSKYQSGQETDYLWSRVHINCAGEVNSV